MSNWRCSLTFCQNLPFDPFVSTFAVHVSICCCERSPLHHSTAMYAWFSGLPCHSFSGGLLCDHQHLRYVVVWVGHVLTVGRMGTEFPSILCKCLRCKTCCMKFCIIFWKDVFSQALVTKCISQFLELVNIVSGISCFFLCTRNQLL